MNRRGLKDGYKIKLRNGLICFVSDGMLISDESTFGLWTCYNEDLTKISNKAYDVMCVYAIAGIGSVDKGSKIEKLWDKIWERQEEPDVEEITSDEAMRRLEESSGKKIKITR